MRFVAGQAAVADGMGHHGRDVLAGAAVAEHLQRGSAGAKCHQEDAACWGAGPPERIADAAGGKERKRITACRCE